MFFLTIFILFFSTFEFSSNFPPSYLPRSNFLGGKGHSLYGLDRTAVVRSKFYNYQRSPFFFSRQSPTRQFSKNAYQSNSFQPLSKEEKVSQMLIDETKKREKLVKEYKQSILEYKTKIDNLKKNSISAKRIRYKRDISIKNEEISQLKYFAKIKHESINKLNQRLNKAKVERNNLNEKLTNRKKDVNEKLTEFYQITSKFFNVSETLKNITEFSKFAKENIEKIKETLMERKKELEKIYLLMVHEANSTNIFDNLQRAIINNRLDVDFKYIYSQMILIDKIISYLQLCQPRNYKIDKNFEELLLELNEVKENDFLMPKGKKLRSRRSYYGPNMRNSPIIKWEPGLSTIEKGLANKQLDLNTLKYDMVNLMNEINEQKNMISLRNIALNSANLELNKTANEIDKKTKESNQLSDEVNALLREKKSMLNKTENSKSQYETLMEVAKNMYVELGMKGGQLQLWKYKLGNIAGKYGELVMAEQSNKAAIEKKEKEYQETIKKLEEALEFVQETLELGNGKGKKEELLQKKITSLEEQLSSQGTVGAAFEKAYEDVAATLFYHPADVPIIEASTYNYFTAKKALLDKAITDLETRKGTFTAQTAASTTHPLDGTATSTSVEVDGTCSLKVAVTIKGVEPTPKFEHSWMLQTCIWNGVFHKVRRHVYTPPTAPGAVDMKPASDYSPLLLNYWEISGGAALEALADKSGLEQVIIYECTYGDCAAS
ncbi:hypothetical protein SNEBB_002261 [Seison nebaliae]|nr:hypothetical protein SNEBB_002261 [Seison nebaliae]